VDRPDQTFSTPVRCVACLASGKPCLRCRLFMDRLPHKWASLPLPPFMGRRWEYRDGGGRFSPSVVPSVVVPPFDSTRPMP